MLQKIGVNMPGLSLDGELISRPVPQIIYRLYILGILSMPVLATKTGQAPNTQHRAAPSIGNNFSRLTGIFVWRRRPFAGRRCHSRLQHRIQPWGVELTTLWLTKVQQGNGTAFCNSAHIRNKHHQRAFDGQSTSSKLGQLLAHTRDVLLIYRPS